MPNLLCKATVAAGVLLLLLLLPLNDPPQSEATTIGGVGQVRYGLSQRKGFDVCSAPSISAMQAFWTGTPYWSVGIYIGGANRYCSQPNLNTSWVTAAHTQGWGFYLIWAGPQAPCFQGGGTKFSLDTATAYQQGRTEAGYAVGGAWSLGMTGRNIYYYDMEAHSGGTACRAAVKAFLNGWVDHLHSLFYPEKAGAYGATCGSYVSDWAVYPWPDVLWAANWNYDPDVWGLLCLSNSNWWLAGERLHQYTGTHNETWNGVTLSIDNDCDNGLITPHSLTTAPDAACTQE